MKTIHSIIIIVLLCLAMVTGINQIFTQAGSNVDLDDHSINLIGQYDTQLLNFSTSFSTQVNESKNLTNYQPDSNKAGDDYKEYFEQKNRVDQLVDTINMAYKLPDLFFLSIPFVDIDDVSFYRNLAWFFIWMSIFIAILVALGQRKLTED